MRQQILRRILSSVTVAPLEYAAERSAAYRYALALFSVVVATLICFALSPSLEVESLYLVFLLAVLFSAWRAGVGAGVFAMLLGLAAADLFFIQPYLQFNLLSRSEILDLVLYLIVGCIAIILTETQRRTNAQALRFAQSALFQQTQLEQEIGERQKVEAALAESEQRFRLATEAIQGLVYDWNIVTGTAWRSPNIMTIIGYNVDEIPSVSKWWTNRIHPEDHAYEEAQFTTAIAQRAPSINTEYRIQHKDGHYVWVWDHSRILYDAHGNLERVIGCTISVDAVKRAQEAQRLMQDLIAALSAALTQQEVAEIVLAKLKHTVGSYQGYVYLFTEDQQSFELIASENMPDVLRTPYSLIPSDFASPLIDAVKTRQPLWLSREQYRTNYPHLAHTGSASPDTEIIVALPLQIDDLVMGGLLLVFVSEQMNQLPDREFMQAIAYYCAQALERATLVDKAKALAALEVRQRVSRDLHDAVSQTLFASTTYLESAQHQWQRNPDKAQSFIEQALRLNRGAMAELRTLLWEMRPESILKNSQSDLLQQLVHAARGRKEMKVELQFEGEDQTLPPDVHVALYRVAQESLNNVLKHSQATQVEVQLQQQTGQFILSIVDNGQGFDTSQTAAGMGMSTMRERAESIGARLDISSAPGVGTRLNLSWYSGMSEPIASSSG